MRKQKVSALVCIALLAACSSGGNASSTVPRGASAAAESGTPGSAPVPAGGVRRTASVATCSGSGTNSFVGGGTGNIAAASISSVVAGSSNEACDIGSAIDGGYGNIVSSGGDSAEYSWIGGGYQNSIGVGAMEAAVAGGNANGITSNYGFIGGGQSNAISGNGYATIGGGLTNIASGEWSTVAGGKVNTASGNGANVAGGAGNTASGQHATVLGGSQNTASGDQSLAAGVNSTAANAGAFVWSDDSSSTGLTSSGINQFLARASGGVTFWTNSAGTVGATLAAGSGAWASASDRNLKEDVVALDDAQVLERVGQLPISSWSYKTEHGVRHVGPMAQDFYAAFGVGEDDRHITAIDEDGVALAAIKALRDQNATLRSQQSNMRRQQAMIRAQERGMRAKEASMEREIAHLDILVRSLTHPNN